MRLRDYEILEGDNLLLIGSGKAFLAQSRATISSVSTEWAYLSAAGVALAVFMKLAFVDTGA